MLGLRRLPKPTPMGVRRRAEMCAGVRGRASGAVLCIHALLLPTAAAFALGPAAALGARGLLTTTAGTAHARIVVAERNSPPPTDRALQDLAGVDAGFASRVVTAASAEHGRLVLSPAGALCGDMDDVRKVGTAAGAGAAAAFAMGANDVTLHVDEAIEGLEHPVDGAGAFKYAALVAKLGVLQRAYVTLQAREAAVPKVSPLKTLVLEPGGHQAGADTADAIEEGRCVRVCVCVCVCVCVWEKKGLKLAPPIAIPGEGYVP